MTAEEMYALYVEFHASRNCCVDTWEELDDRERGAWEFIAERVNA